MSIIHELSGEVTADDTESPYWIQGAGYRSVPGFPHIHILIDGSEVWNARSERSLSIYHQHGYPYVAFSGRSWRLQRLVLAAWFPGCLDHGEMALHRTNDRDNVAVWNLYPGDFSRNVQDRMRDAGNADNCCSRGHLYVPCNLVPSSLKRGWRSCLACNRGRSKVSGKRREGSADYPAEVQDATDEAYAKILGSLVGTLRFQILNGSKAVTA